VLLCEGDTVIALGVNASSHASNKSLTRIARVYPLVLVTTSLARAEDNKETRYGKNR
jgi:hypothetical protein